MVQVLPMVVMVSTHSRLKAAGSEIQTTFVFKELFQHTAA